MRFMMIVKDARENSGSPAQAMVTPWRSSPKQSTKAGEMIEPWDSPQLRRSGRQSGCWRKNYRD